jgi:hypothetical protein
MIKSKHAKGNPKKERLPNHQETPSTNTPEVADGIMAFADVSLEERHQLIAHAAYLRAAHRGFAPGHELDDWLGAEAEINGRLSRTKTGNLNKLI